MSTICTSLLALTAFSVAIAQPAGIPRPEYPQPQFRRELWMNLNGNWEFEIDRANVGLRENWANGKRLGRSILVPYSPESKMSGIEDTSMYSIVWYKRSITLPASFSGKRVLLNFGAVDY